MAPTYPLYAGAAIFNNAGTVTNAVITVNFQDVSWTNLVGVSVSGNNLTKTASTDWYNARASSTQVINSGNGYVEFTASETTTNRMLGLGQFGTGDYTYSNIRYAIYLGANVLYTSEYGALTNVGSYSSGDKLRLSIENGAVKYYKNGTLLRTSTLAPAYPLYVNVALYQNGSTLTGAIINDGTSSAGSSAQINWLVSDHLGTPRMIFDQTGSLANTKRHDYLPFGEELFAPTGGRTAAMGYCAGDGVRQQFTLKERDVETGLDYFLARYYSANQGRFTGVDPDNYQARLDLGDPQSWNAYSYVNNNPLARVDPDGKGFFSKLKNWIVYDVWGEEEDVARQEAERRQILINTQKDNGGRLIIQNLGGDLVEVDPSRMTRLQVFFWSNRLMDLWEQGVRSRPLNPDEMVHMGNSMLGSPALKGDPYHDDTVKQRVRPEYKRNPAHDPRSPQFNPAKTVEPADAAVLYQKSVRGGFGTWYARGPNDLIYRYFSDNAGGVHFSGIVSKAEVPKNVLQQLGF